MTQNQYYGFLSEQYQKRIKAVCVPKHLPSFDLNIYKYMNRDLYEYYNKLYQDGLKQ